MLITQLDVANVITVSQTGLKNKDSCIFYFPFPLGKIIIIIMYKSAWFYFASCFHDIFIGSYTDWIDFFFQLVFENVIYKKRLNGLNLFSLPK